MTMSEITLFRERQAQEEAAARLGLAGPAIVSRHDFIEARAERGAESILRMIAQGKLEEAAAKMDLPDWGLEGGEGQEMSHFEMTNCYEKEA